MNDIFDNIEDYPANFTCAEYVPIDNGVSEVSHNTNGHSAQFASVNKHSTFVDPEGKLKVLLTEWNLEVVYQRCLDQLIDFEVLGLMNEKHVEILLSDFPLGIRIKFENRVKRYQEKETQAIISEPFTVDKSSSHQVAINNTDSSSQSPTSLSENNVFQLQNVLTSSAQGSLILEYYNKNKILNESCRNILVEIIISDVIKRDGVMTLKLANCIAEAIVGSFPTEIKDSYFIKDSITKSPKGKLYIKYYNTVRSMKQNGLIETVRKEKLKKQVSRTMDRDNNIHVAEPNSEQDSSYLMDTDLTWPEVEKIWKKTVNFRQNFIKENDTRAIFEKFHHYTKPMGYKLVDIDFKNVYPEHQQLNLEFDRIYSKLITVLNERVKDCASRKLLEQLNSTQDLSVDSKSLIVLYLLHSIFIPTSKKVTRDENGKKGFIKFSIKDSQNAFIIIKPTAVEMDATLQNMSSKHPIQPCVLVIGSLMDPKQILIYFDTIKYKMFSALKAYDMCFKIFHVFNVEYPIESHDVWLFIQTFFYNIKTKYDKSNVLIKQISVELNT